MIPIGTRCSVIGCKAIVVANGFCGKHYKRVQRHGDPLHRKSAEALGFVNADKHPLYNVWRNITRAARGSLVCDRWKRFENFVEDVKERPSLLYTFERIESSGLFEPENVMWRESVTTPEYKENHAEYMRGYNKRKRDTNPDYFRNVELKRNYGVTLDWYNQQLEKQKGVCAICGKPEIETSRFSNLAVDHCHDKKHVRGLLCSKCNRAIGGLNHDVKLLQSAIEYLKQNTPDNLQ